MKALYSLLILCTAIFYGCSSDFKNETSAPQKKAVMILIDGVPTDVLKAVDTPTIDAIAAEGGFAETFVGGEKGGYSETPTISAPGYMNMITGVWGYKHNVWGNGVKEPNYNYWSIFRLAEEVKPELQTAIFSTWEDNRTKLIGEGKAATNNLKLDYSFDGFELDTVNYPHLPDRKFIFDIDELVSKKAGEYLATEAPDLSWVYLEFTDDMGHKFGDSPEMNEAVKKADLQIKRVWETIQKREKEFNEEWMIVVTTDHGRSPKDGKGHGYQSDRERATWMVTNVSDLNSHFKKSSGIVDIMPSVAHFLGLEMPEDLKAEMDGTSFIGALSFDDLSISLDQNKLNVKWHSISSGEEVEVFYTVGNAFKTGGHDEYKKLGTSKIEDEKVDFELPDVDKDELIKVVVKAKHNWANKWIVPQATPES